jgi:hypothetical protein
LSQPFDMSGVYIAAQPRTLINIVQACAIVCNRAIARQPILSGMNEKEARRFWAKVDKGDGCWNWTSDKCAGYGKFWFRGGCRLAHRVLWVSLNGPIAEGLCLRHKCDNPACVRPDHLEVGTHGDNFMDSYSRGRRHYQRGTVPRGEAHWLAKLTEETVQEIRRGAAAGLSARQMAEPLGLSPTHVRRVIRRKAWAWLP